MDITEDKTRPCSDEPVHPANAILPKDNGLKEESKQLQKPNNEAA